MSEAGRAHGKQLTLKYARLSSFSAPDALQVAALGKNFSLALAQVTRIRKKK